MGSGSVAKAAVSTTPGWGLAPACAALTQGLVVSPFAHLPAAEALFLGLPAEAGGAWLGTLRARTPITDAGGQTQPCAAIAFTFGGLAAMGLDAGVLASFSDPFREGMQQIDRRRRLGDDGPSVIDGGPIWSGGAEAPVAVHAVLLLYARDDGALDAECEKARGVLAGAGVEIRRRVRLTLRLDEHGISREHFGFADGISQPLPFGPEIRTSGGAAASRDPWHGVAVGDVLMGYPDAHDELAAGPLVSALAGFLDLGANGSYLVVRELRQDVARFWTSMDDAAIAAADPALDADGLAAKAIGRTRGGAPLAPEPVPIGPDQPDQPDRDKQALPQTLERFPIAKPVPTFAESAPGAPSPAGEAQPANAFGYFQGDPHGFSCPLGAHVRRANPRDGLARDAAGAPGMLTFSNHHRILRRGRKFGPDIANPRIDDGAERGLLFMCLVTDLARQFEFVQQNWLLNPPFATLFDETDPMLGPLGPFTLPGQPLRRRVAVETFVRFAGGEYFFLPSVPALDYLAGLG
ncbi:MAG: hypothetical protein M3T55_14050 [Pseudomonadota bacterium]|nr:hypothetical protein [Pseudomonadota bacterium]